MQGIVDKSIENSTLIFVLEQQVCESENVTQEKVYKSIY